jgi:cytochrome c peroxidase
MPQTGFQGAIESLNQAEVAQPGSIRTRFSLRKPRSAAYAAFSPPLFYADKQGEAKCTHCFIGGNFWDLRATGQRFQNPTAMQAEGSPLNPFEMANSDAACLIYRMSQRPYKELFESVWACHCQPTSMRCATGSMAIPARRSGPKFRGRTPRRWWLT